jgi:hypothetical protein
MVLMAAMRYILDGHTTVPCEDLSTWAEWYKNADRQVGDTTVGEALISTVFLSMNHNFGQGEPILFETMVFSEGSNDTYEEFTRRYETWDDAWHGHCAVVNQLKYREGFDKATEKVASEKKASISVKTLDGIDQSVTNMNNGVVSDPIDFDDFYDTLGKGQTMT